MIRVQYVIFLDLASQLLRLNNLVRSFCSVLESHTPTSEKFDRRRSQKTEIATLEAQLSKEDTIFGQQAWDFYFEQLNTFWSLDCY